MSDRDGSRTYKSQEERVDAILDASAERCAASLRAMVAAYEACDSPRKGNVRLWWEDGEPVKLGSLMDLLKVVLLRRTN